MQLSPTAATAFADGVELRFGSQPLDVARAAGVEFHDIDRAALEAAASAGVGSTFLAAMPGWGIVCQRPRSRVIRVLRMMPAGARTAPAGDVAMPGRDAQPGGSDQRGRGHDLESLRRLARSGN